MPDVIFCLHALIGRVAQYVSVSLLLSRKVESSSNPLITLASLHGRSKMCGQRLKEELQLFSGFVSRLLCLLKSTLVGEVWKGGGGRNYERLVERESVRLWMNHRIRRLRHLTLSALELFHSASDGDKRLSHRKNN